MLIFDEKYKPPALSLPVLTWGLPVYSTLAGDPASAVIYECRQKQYILAILHMLNPFQEKKNDFKPAHAQFPPKIVFFLKIR